MFVDLMGGIFSDLSLVFKADLDVIAAVTYSIVVVSPLNAPRIFILSKWVLGHGCGCHHLCSDTQSKGQ